MSFLKIVNRKKDKQIRTFEPFDIQRSNLHFRGWHTTFRLNGQFLTIDAMPSMLCSSQILFKSEFGQSIPTVVHTVRELQL